MAAEKRAHILATFRRLLDTTTTNDAQVVESKILSQPLAEVQHPTEVIKIFIADANETGLEAFPQIAKRLRRSLTDLAIDTGKHRLKFSTAKYQVAMYRWSVHYKTLQVIQKNICKICKFDIIV